jgi:DNA invertase Pin-like site-specific DNA recombinase
MMSLVDSHMREWDTILVFDQSRFSRLDKDDAVRWFVLLRDNDVSLISSIEGIIVDPEAEDDDLGQSLKRDVIQYSKHRYLKDLAQNVASGRFRRGKQGIIGGPVPYGCRRRPDKRFERGPESEIKVLRWMFRCADLGWTCSAIAAELNRRGVFTANGKYWSAKAVKDKLTNRIYIGARKAFRTHTGKHVHITADGVVKVARKDRGVTIPDPNGGIETDTPDFVGRPLIEASLFERVQQRVKDRTFGKHDRRALPLAGIATCGLCGAKLLSVNAPKGSKRYPYYRCSAAHLVKGLPKNHPNFSVPAEWLWNTVKDRLVSAILTDGNAIGAAKVFERELKKHSRTGKADIKQFSRKLSAVNEKLEAAKRNMVYAPNRDAVAIFASEISRLTDEANKLRTELATASAVSEAAISGLQEVTQRLVREFRERREALLGNDYQAAVDVMRATVKEILVPVTVFSDESRHRNRFEYGEPQITMRSGLEMAFGEVCITGNNSSQLFLVIHTSDTMAQ